MNTNYFTLITGASDGLGKFMAIEFASRNHPLILVALPRSPLLNVADYIRNQYNVEVHCVFEDLSSMEGCCELHRRVKELGVNVGYLVNNAGLGNTNPFAEKSVSFYTKQIGINVIAPTMLSRLFLPDLMAYGKGGILNVSSLTSYFQIPNKQVYCATKSFLLAFSKALDNEMYGTGLHVSVVCPGGMNTRLPIILATKERKGIARWSVMNPEEVASITVPAFLAGKKVIIPGHWNQVFLAIDRIIPASLKRRMIRKQVSNAETFENNQSTSPINSVFQWFDTPNAA
jgi:short-subunit dehydrogenase